MRVHMAHVLWEAANVLEDIGDPTARTFRRGAARAWLETTLEALAEVSQHQDIQPGCFRRRMLRASARSPALFEI